MNIFFILPLLMLRTPDVETIKKLTGVLNYIVYKLKGFPNYEGYEFAAYSKR